MKIDLRLGDCLEVMKDIPDGSIDLILCDPPYGTTACKWDSIIPLEPMWEQVWRIIKPDCAVAIFGGEPFSTHVRMSAMDNYRHDWYWDKKFGGNFVQAKRMPLKSIENIMIFSSGKKLPLYYPIMVQRDKPIVQGGTNTSKAIPVQNNARTHTKKVYDKKYPVTRLDFPKSLGRSFHPTQKPVSVMEYLIKTYTNEGETVLDFAMGSGTTGVACRNLNRNFIGIELDAEYFEIAEKRIGNED